MGDHTQNGGPAFPQAINPAEHGRGMTLRDYFAAKALNGYLSCEDVSDVAEAELAFAAYRMADAMLKARGT